MDIALLIESILLSGLSILGIWEGIRLLRQEHTMGDLIGPGGFVLSVSAVLFLITIVYLLRMYLTRRGFVKTQWVRPRFGTIGRLMVVLGLYVVAVPIVGYAIGSAIFFILAFKISGVKSWGRSTAVGIVVALAFELVFSRYAGISFP